MGNEQSDRCEENAFAVIKEIPVVNGVYGSIRTAVYNKKGDKQRAQQSIKMLGVPQIAMPGFHIDTSKFIHKVKLFINQNGILILKFEYFYQL